MPDYRFPDMNYPPEQWHMLAQRNRERIARNQGPTTLKPEKATGDEDTDYFRNVVAQYHFTLSKQGAAGLNALAQEWNYGKLSDLLEAIGWGLFVLIPQPLPNSKAQHLD